MIGNFYFSNKEVKIIMNKILFILWHRNITKPWYRLPNWVPILYKTDHLIRTSQMPKVLEKSIFHCVNRKILYLYCFLQEIIHFFSMLIYLSHGIFLIGFVCDSYSGLSLFESMLLTFLGDFFKAKFYIAKLIFTISFFCF